LSDEQLKLRSAEPSALSLLGLVRHLTDVERDWFRRGAAGEKGPQVGPIYYRDEQPEGHIDEVDDADPAAMFARGPPTSATRQRPSRCCPATSAPGWPRRSPGTRRRTPGSPGCGAPDRR
jgi:Protein of unknown function (DUF664)